MAGVLKVDSINADSNLALKIANTAVAFIDATGLRPTSGNVSLDATATSKFYLPSANTVAIQTAGVTAVTVDSSQNVTLAGTLTTTGITNSGVATATRFNPTGSSVTGNGLYLPAANSLGLSTNGTNAVYINSSQNVGIGTASPSTKLAVAGGISGTGAINISGGGWGTLPYVANSLVIDNNSGESRFFATGADASTDGSYLFYTSQTDGGTNERMSINSSGYLKCLGVYNQTNPNAANVFVGSGGDLYRSTSSLKYKKNIENSVHGLTDLLNLRSVTYQSNNPDNGEQVFGGFIAEEVHDAGLTEFVQYAEDGSPDALAYGNMVALCVKSIQELKALNDTQAATIAALTARMVAVESK